MLLLITPKMSLKIVQSRSNLPFRGFGKTGLTALSRRMLEETRSAIFPARSFGSYHLDGNERWAAKRSHPSLPALEMELRPPTSPSTNCLPKRAITISNFKVQSANNPSTGSPFHFNSHGKTQKNHLVSSALPETAASVVVSAIAVGAAAALLARTKKASDPSMSSLKICEDCGGSGICAECNGEGFVLKKMSEESAEKARMAAKNMATRYTAGLPKKWSYCSKCSSARSCRTCGGTGRVSW